MKRTVARARITVTLEVDADSKWGPEVSLTQVYDQGSHDAIAKLQAAIGSSRGFRILKDSIKVTAVVVAEEA